ncbi:MAG: GxxExxY protein [Puniceicoccales bacterium]
MDADFLAVGWRKLSGHQIRFASRHWIKPFLVMKSDIRDIETYAIIGAAMTVHRELGHGFMENVYQEALAMELKFAKVSFEREKEIPVYYRESRLNVFYRADFICYGSIIVETKALAKTTSKEESQVLNYLKGTRLTRGLLLNFGSPSLEYKRLVLNHTN